MTSEAIFTIESTLLDSQIADHEGQLQQLTQGLQQLESDFNQKKVWATATMEQLRGAILALQGLREAAVEQNKKTSVPDDPTKPIE